MSKFSRAAVTASIRRRRKGLRMINPVITYEVALAFKICIVLVEEKAIY